VYFSKPTSWSSDTERGSSDDEAVRAKKSRKRDIVNTCNDDVENDETGQFR